MARADPPSLCFAALALIEAVWSSLHPFVQDVLVGSGASRKDLGPMLGEGGSHVFWVGRDAPILFSMTNLTERPPGRESWRRRRMFSFLHVYSYSGRISLAALSYWILSVKDVLASCFTCSFRANFREGPERPPATRAISE